VSAETRCLLEVDDVEDVSLLSISVSRIEFSAVAHFGDLLTMTLLIALDMAGGGGVSPSVSGPFPRGAAEEDEVILNGVNMGASLGSSGSP